MRERQNKKARSTGKVYIWQQPDWPLWRYDASCLTAALADVHHAHDHLLGRMRDLEPDQRDRAYLHTLAEEVLKTSEIEGERLSPVVVRSSVVRRLGLGLAPSDQHVDGVVDMVLDATVHCDRPLTVARLLAWHAALFPTGHSGRFKIRTGAWRDDALGPMQVVSGAFGPRQVVHYEAPPASRLEADMAAFLLWFEGHQETDPILKAGLAHLWLVTLHPFDDGNGRVARAVGAMALARAARAAHQFYSFSAQVMRERQGYYDTLERTQAGSLDVTGWLQWFLGCLLRAIPASHP